jgi:hypothetical protein
MKIGVYELKRPFGSSEGLFRKGMTGLMSSDAFRTDRRYASVINL